MTRSASLGGGVATGVQQTVQAGAAAATRALAAERRRVDRAGARLFRELEPDRVHWSIVSELSRLVAADLACLMAPVAGCDHPPGCERPGCAHTLVPRASLGNVDPGFAGRRFDAAEAWLGGALAADGSVVVDPAPSAPEGLVTVAAARVGDPPVALLVLGRRRSIRWSRVDLERMERLGVFVEAALGAAGERRRAEERAILRERRRVAKELHDTVGQLLFGAGVAARMARESAGTNRPDAVERLLASEQEIGRATAALRHALRALDGPRGTQGALPASVSETVEAFRHRAGTPTQMLVLGDRRGLALEDEQLLVRVAAEALRNVERHSGATEVVVTLSFEGSMVALVVQDDGQGLSPSGSDATGLGLDLLREECRVRGGGLALGPNDDGGATLRAWVPAG